MPGLTRAALRAGDEMQKLVQSDWDDDVLKCAPFPRIPSQTGRKRRKEFVRIVRRPLTSHTCSPCCRFFCRSFDSRPSTLPFPARPPPPRRCRTFRLLSRRQVARGEQHIKHMRAGVVAKAVGDMLNQLQRSRPACPPRSLFWWGLQRGLLGGGPTNANRPFTDRLVAAQDYWAAGLRTLPTQVRKSPLWPAPPGAEDLPTD